jgi:hypothetical protein
METRHRPDEIDGLERINRELHDCLGVTYHTDVMHELGSFRFSRDGFADIPRLNVEVVCKEADFQALVPHIRRLAFGHLGERGWHSDNLRFKPTVGRGRTRMFNDQSTGARKRGVAHTVSFELSMKLARAIDWTSRLNGKLIVRESEVA